SAGDEPPTPLPQPVLYFRRTNEPPQSSRQVRRSIPGRVMDVHETLRAMLVHAYRWPAAQVRGPFDELWIAWDPPGSPGITSEDLQRGAGIITVAVSPALDAELERTAERIHAQSRTETAPDTA